MAALMPSEASRMSEGRATAWGLQQGSQRGRPSGLYSSGLQHCPLCRRSPCIVEEAGEGASHRRWPRE